jgi:2-polyprenyl-3-methyl-5-hydroxy-6-metoxy-1,4-benzoquinol methylase
LKLCGRQPGLFLDIGAGFGFFSRAASENGFQVDALEPSPSCQDVFTLMNGFKPYPEMLSASFVQKHSGIYDVVLMSQVLEHVSDIKECVSNLNILLHSGGICAIAVPHFRSLVSMVQCRKDMFIIPPEHLNFFTIRGLTSLFLRQGFKPLKIETISRFNSMRIRRIFPFSSLIILGLSSVLNLADMYNKGMFINAYFQKVS